MCIRDSVQDQDVDTRTAGIETKRLQIGEATEESVDRCLLALTSTELVVVDEVIGQEPGAGARITLVDRLFIETADQLNIFGGTH